MNYEALFAETVLMRGHQGDQIDAYLARPLGVSAAPGVVVIHHMPGWDGPTKEIARRFAHHGYVAISPNLHFREGKADAAGEQRQRAGGRRDAGRPDHGRRPGRRRLSPGAAVRQRPGRRHRLLLGRPAVLPGRVHVRGLDAAVDCYGGGVVAKPEELTPRQPVAPIELTRDLQCPLLGLFGVEDTRPSPADTAKTKEALDKFGKTYEFHTYDNAGHAFFAVDRPQYRQAAAVDGWEKVFAFFGKHLR